MKIISFFNLKLININIKIFTIGIILGLINVLAFINWTTEKSFIKISFIDENHQVDKKIMLAYPAFFNYQLKANDDWPYRNLFDSASISKDGQYILIPVKNFMQEKKGEGANQKTIKNAINMTLSDFSSKYFMIFNKELNLKLKLLNKLRTYLKQADSKDIVYQAYLYNNIMLLEDRINYIDFEKTRIQTSVEVSTLTAFDVKKLLEINLLFKMMFLFFMPLILLFIAINKTRLFSKLI